MRHEFDLLCLAAPRHGYNRSTVVFDRSINGDPDRHAGIVCVVANARIDTGIPGRHLNVARFARDEAIFNHARVLIGTKRSPHVIEPGVGFAADDQCGHRERREIQAFEIGLLHTPHRQVVSEVRREAHGTTVSRDGTQPLDWPLDEGLRVIRDGLKAEDRVIVDGIQRARVGAKVTPQTAPAGGKS